MKAVFTYTDYRDLLRDYYEDRKSEGGFMSYRWLGRKLGVDASLLVKILRNERHLSDDSLPAFLNLLNLAESENDFVQALFGYSRATQDQELRFYFEQMKVAAGVQFERLGILQYSFYESWRNVALWALLHATPNQTPTYYAERLHPHSTPSEVEACLSLLADLKMLSYDESGRMILHAKHLGTGAPADRNVLRGFYRQMLELASHSLEEIPSEAREISGITVAADADALEDIKEIVREARKKIQRRVDEVDKAQGVYQVSFQVFPLSSFEIAGETEHG